MPLVKVIGPYHFRFYSRGEVNEPPRIHVRRDRLVAKFWLTPEVRLARPGPYRSWELNDIARLVKANRREFLEAWYEYFG